jgi:adenylosuccinate synthase
MSVTVVVGLQWGDEGKGKIIDFLSSSYDVIARYSGGANAAHTVLSGNTEVCLHQVPSGIFSNAKLLMTDGMVIDPILLYHEIKYLEKIANLDSDRLLIGGLAPVSMPYHKLLDTTSDTFSRENYIGSTGMGIGPTRADQSARQCIRLFEYLDQEFLLGIEFNRRVNKLLTYSPLVSQFSGAKFDSLKNYKVISNYLKNKIIDSAIYVKDCIENDKKILFEGTQGTMLDMNFGMYPYVTSSSTLAGYVCSGTGVSPKKISKIIGVMKSYSTRVSNGPMVTEVFGETKNKLTKYGKEVIHSTDISLRVGWLDLVVIRRSLVLNIPNELVLTKLDVFDYFNEILICVSYLKDGKEYKILPYDYDYSKYEPLYVAVKGWNANTSKITNAKNFINFVQTELEMEFSVISVGRYRDQTIKI